ncbi:MAG TPA: ammonia-forming cytochrome c nitrite reductase subunit c552 [Myxococcales bacterium]|nr:ammonia-forming cytochrome c nitrite reductase subunit c552 [Myxococcales bacterium]
MSDSVRALSRRKWLMMLGAVGGGAAAAAAGVTALLLDIHTKKQQAQAPFFRVVELTDQTEDPAVWGKSFPLQYDGYRRTAQMARTKHGGSEAVPRTATESDPRTTVAHSRLEEDPRLETMWAGYAFAVDFREERGHAYMLGDQTYTERQKASPQPGACVHCHASVYVPYMRLGDGDLIKGFEKMNPLPYAEARKQVEHPVACIDCHDPKTMELRVTRPGFIEGIKRAKAAEGIEGYEVNTMASRQEMRSYVCGQCHVEYHFKGEEKRLTYPWHDGLKVEAIADHYDAEGFSDWTHAKTGAKVLKAQHPEFEMWNQGIHARAGVACADCHMPFMREGAQKISSHHVRSPLLDLNRSCQSCHRASEAELRARVEEIQDRVYRLRNQAMDALVGLIGDLERAREAGRGDAELARARYLQRRAQFFLDFVEAENSTGFHAPEEAERILAEAIDFARQGQISLRDAEFAPTVALPAAFAVEAAAAAK